MKKAGTKFTPGKVIEWLDCGNKDATVYTNQRVLEFIKHKEIISATSSISNSTIIEPCYIGDHVSISNSVVGPHVSIGNNTVVKDSIIKNTIIQTNSILEGQNLANSMVGNHTTLSKESESLSIGDFNEIKINQ
jgi:glucose-1-phosphate thymidylyltransferase